MCSAPALSQDAGVQTSDELIVYGTVVTRNRTDAVPPTLSYDLEYFQRFEPISAGDALKRLPGVSFSSDVLEYDQVQLRGLPPTYAQVQVNGQNMTGSGNDRVFFVDRIPAELIDGIEVIRSPSADMSSEGIGGTVNAKLKRAGQFTGGWVRGSGFGVIDDELRGAGSVGYGNTFGETSYLMSVDVQQRRNPKEKTAIFTEQDGTFDGRETQEDTRDGTDYAFNGEVSTKVGEGTLRLYGFYVLTDREETEFTQSFDDAMDLDEIETQLEDINQQNMSIASEYKANLGPGEVLALVGYNRFQDDTYVTETSSDDPGERGGEDLDTTDEDWFGTLAYTLNASQLVSVKVGIDGRIRNRDFRLAEWEQEGSDPIESELVANGLFNIEERRLDPYIKANWNITSSLAVETGLRFEHTERALSGADFNSSSSEFDELNPSLHVRYGVTDTTLLRFSLARTVLRPSFDQLTPAAIEDEPVDDLATVGNPNLQQETAWGIDVGFDQKIGDRGILGFNYFNRNIKDKIELVGTGETFSGCEGGTCDVLSYKNLGDARAYGIEVDLDMPLTAIGLANTTIFANYTWLNSELTDPVTGQERRFTDQPSHIYNIGLIQALPSWNSTFGVTYQKRGDSYEFEYDEITKLSYDGNLEAFWETRLSKSTVIRLTGANLLDAEKVEDVQKYSDNIAEDKDGKEVETEKSGRLIMMTVRQSF